MIFVCLVHQKQTQTCEVILELYLVAVEHAEVILVSEYLMRQSDRCFGVLHGLSVFLGLTQDGAELQLELALHMHLLHPLGDADVLEEVRLLNNLNSFFQVNNAFL